MGLIKLYIASSIDGYIARPDGNLDWLTATPPAEEGDYGYSELLANTGTILMGRKTYEEVLGFDAGWPYRDFDSYVVTRQKDYRVSTPETYVLSDQVEAFVNGLREKEKDTWLVGGGELIRYFLDNDLIDTMILTIVPVILGKGIPLFPGSTRESRWVLEKVEKFSTGLVGVTYLRHKA